MWKDFVKFLTAKDSGKNVWPHGTSHLRKEWYHNHKDPLKLRKDENYKAVIWGPVLFIIGLIASFI